MKDNEWNIMHADQQVSRTLNHIGGLDRGI